jgi:hypothetical protein
MRVDFEETFWANVRIRLEIVIRRNTKCKEWYLSGWVILKQQAWRQWRPAQNYIIDLGYTATKTCSSKQFCDCQFFSFSLFMSFDFLGSLFFRRAKPGMNVRAQRWDQTNVRFGWEPLATCENSVELDGHFTNVAASFQLHDGVLSQYVYLSF